MDQIDGSIAAGIKTPEQNPIAMANAIAELKNNLINAASNQQQYNARQAIGPIYQQSIDPATGQLDANNLMINASKNPATAWMAGDLAKQAQERQTSQLGIDTSGLALAHQRWSLVGDSLLPLLNSPKPLTSEDVYQSAASLASMAPFRSKEAMDGMTQALSQLPQNANDGQIRDFIKNIYLQSHSNREGISSVLGEPTQTNTGGASVFTRVNPLTNTVSPMAGGSIPNTLSPGDKATPVQTFQNGQPGFVMKGNLTDQYGNTPGAGGQSGPVPGAPTGAGPQGGVAQSRGFIPTGPKLGASSAADVTGSASAQQGIDLQHQADQVPQQNYLLDNMKELVDHFSPGPAADNFKKLKQTWAQITGRPDESLASQEDFNKSAELSFQQDFKALGGTGTDKQLGSAMSSNPNQELSRMGIKAIIALKQGLNDAIAVKNKTWQQWLQSGQGGPQDYGKFSTEFNQIYNPRVFQVQHMTPDARASMFKDMSQQQKVDYNKSLANAIKAGWIKPDGQ